MSGQRLNLDHGGRPVVQGVQGLAVSTETLNKASIETEYLLQCTRVRFRVICMGKSGKMLWDSDAAPACGRSIHWVVRSPVVTRDPI
jgi:hypothetical protein